MTTQQTDLPLFTADPESPDLKIVLAILERASDWIRADDLLEILRLPQTSNTRRWLRAMAKASKGHIVGGQKGYRLTGHCTQEEYQHWRNWMKSQSDEMTARILEADKVFYRRQPVTTGNGILNTEGATTNGHE